jgi:hypothetical protein
LLLVGIRNAIAEVAPLHVVCPHFLQRHPDLAFGIGVLGVLVTGAGLNLPYLIGWVLLVWPGAILASSYFWDAEGSHSHGFNHLVTWVIQSCI